MAAKKKQPGKKEVRPRQRVARQVLPWDGHRLVGEIGKGPAAALAARMVWLAPGRVASFAGGGLSIQADVEHLIDVLTENDPMLVGDELTEEPTLIVEALERSGQKLPASVAAWLALAPRCEQALGRWKMAGLMDALAKWFDGAKPAARAVELGIVSYNEAQAGLYPFALIAAAATDGDWLAVFVLAEGSDHDDDMVPRIVGFIHRKSQLANLTTLLGTRKDVFTGFGAEDTVFAGPQALRLPLRWLHQKRKAAHVAFLQAAPVTFWAHVTRAYDDARENAEEWFDSDEPAVDEDALDQEFTALMQTAGLRLNKPAQKR